MANQPAVAVKIMVSTKKKGIFAEEIAVKFLKNQGYKILERNWKLRNIGEVDIVAKKKKTLNFVEVKSLSNYKDFKPENHFNKKKYQKIMKIASFYANKNNAESWIISLIAIIFDNDVKINYYENIQI